MVFTLVPFPFKGKVGMGMGSMHHDTQRVGMGMGSMYRDTQTGLEFGWVNFD